jgi:hypothetical protein
MKNAAAMIIAACLLTACIHEPDETVDEPCFSARVAMSHRVIEHVAGDCSHMGYPRTMAPGEAIEIIDSEECGVRINTWLACSQLGADLYAMRIRYFDEDQIWEQWLMTLEIGDEVCVEEYVVTFESVD